MAVCYAGTSLRRRSTAQLPRLRVWLRGAVIEQARDEVIIGCRADGGQRRGPRSLFAARQCLSAVGVKQTLGCKRDPTIHGGQQRRIHQTGRLRLMCTNCDDR